ncbi:hypothetical protein KY290_032384 [Solanum tuberosum]|uniref:Aminotransferase-like plant mobile domain-containing protein n=1 Tax=Solanum tuberosum TaxID=4113 RepID=A0ABQ7UDK7_SOLTU|nr:hypothetical protein KY290_032384 [Solanum tuberosum]
MVDSSEVGIMEEREEVMVSSVDEEVKPIFRVAHFLKPTTKKLPFLPSRLKISCSSLKVQFRGGFSYMKGWSKWVDELKPLHQEIWKKAGIFEGIIASTFKIYRHSDLILALAERWCLETNTFILPWGEATITLEDMVVLGGFSVLGHSVLKPVKTKDSVDIEKALCEVHKDVRVRKTNVGHHAWMEHFAGRGDHLEHVAFLTLWLSRYVLPARSCQFVDRSLFPIAIYLSQGIPIALAPAVLASIYRDMSLLKQLIVSSAKNHALSDSRCIEDELNPNLRAPFQFVQLWAWERFTNLQPKPSSIIYTGEPRVARWHKVKKLNHVDPRSGIDSAAECFLWRPYAVDIVKNWEISRFYKERDEYVVVGPNMGREIMTFARLVRASELVGMDCIEQYNPHRVSMQFGFDQDVPDCVNHASDHIPKIAWTNYNRPIKDVKLYIPSRFIESDVSRRYLEWWKNQNVAPEVAVQHEKMNAIVCCGFLQKCEMIVVESSSDDDDNIPISVSLRKRKLMKKEITIPGNNQELFLNMQSQSSSSSNDGTAKARETLLESKPKSAKFEASNGKSDEDGDGPYVVKEMVPLESKNNNDKGGCKLNFPDGIELASDGPNAGLLSTNPAKTLQMNEASVVTPKVTAMSTNITEGNMAMGNINNHEKGSRRFEMIDILKLEMRIRNLENINAGKVPIFRTK